MTAKVRIYTKGGDKGETSLLGGLRVPKFHDRIEAYGTVDELCSFIGLIADLQSREAPRKLLREIQERLFTTESLLAAEDPALLGKLPRLDEKDIRRLELEIDAMNESLPELRSFILPGGHPVVSYCHIARTVCRRAERNIIRLDRNEPVDPLIIQYLNRLSDFLFVFARKTAQDLGAGEIPWKPGKE
ncbi:MAG: cob(I)yrinic acid a,c-diamide adenosyltransferase [Bacteroidales bacterium]|nr:cob(I)yrinic acid a,c-diamide adenosyltransferase [Bacteroidales bacterium]